MIKNLHISLLVILLSACGGTGAADANNSNGEFSYQLTENGCDTGMHTFGSLKDYCGALKNDELNKGCAGYLRELTYKQECSSQGPF